MVVQVLPAERQRASVVGIAPQRDRAVRPGVGRGEARHRLHTLAVGLRDVETERLAIKGGQQEELRDQAVVRDRSLEVDAVRVDLPRDLVAQDRPGPRLPAPRVLALAEEEAREGQARSVRGAVVAVHVRDLEVPAGEVPVQVESAQEPLAEGGVRPRAAAVEDAEEPGPAQDPERRLHRGGPVHGLRVRIGVDPALEHRAHGFGVALFAREQVRLARRHQPLEPREIPGHLDVARIVRVHIDDVAHVAVWPGDARLVVPQPVDVRPEIHRLGPEQPHSVGEGVPCGRQDPLFVARA